jgi:hypothetical protein
MPRYSVAQMNRARQDEIRRQQEAATDALVSKLSTRKPRRASSNKVREQTEAMIAGDFSEATARHLVMYYAIMHEKLYGVPPGEITDSTPIARKNMQGAESAARRMLREEFRENPVDMASFIYWIFKRELFKRTKAKDNGRPPSDFRPGWRLVFSSRTMYTDYMVAQKTRASR